MVGGTVSIATTYLAERQKAKTAASGREQERQADAYLAGRIIQIELTDAESILRVAIQKSPFVWPPATGYLLPTTAWSEYSARLAPLAGGDVWEQVAAVYSTFNYANLLGELNADTARTLLAETESAIALLADVSVGVAS